MHPALDHSDRYSISPSLPYRHLYPLMFHVLSWVFESREVQVKDTLQVENRIEPFHVRHLRDSLFSFFQACPQALMTRDPSI
ncbi:hypothetical protein BCR34DRAFT_553260 [Clohesyomyces aquaticus]|uniref:Uncharacterized protein n=1 Tax=Clohesyomyces aquaticus TaxID=1231657 RepID=A0A1Y2A831_9PLEO|nr:hypothetical protein BCR34DRAFT_553260 [Clohesyomyces aquaticus]